MELHGSLAWSCSLCKRRPNNTFAISQESQDSLWLSVIRNPQTLISGEAGDGRALRRQPDGELRRMFVKAYSSIVSGVMLPIYIHIDPLNAEYIMVSFQSSLD